MQRIRSFDGKRIIIFIVIPIILLAAFIAIDQITKFFAEKDQVKVTVIDNFFYLSYSVNRGAGFSLFADKEWGQTLFKIITPVALVGFAFLYAFAVKKSYKWLTYAAVLIVAGTVGNYIDRLINSQVVDFLSFQFGNYYFPTFNVADVCLTLGVIMLIIHFLFFDGSAVFKSKPKSDNGDEAELNEDENA